jgi:hypothetical protein
MTETVITSDNTLVGLHFRRYPEVDANIYDNALLVRALGELGVSSVLIPGHDAYDLIDKTLRAYPMQLSKAAGLPSIQVGPNLQEYLIGPEGVGAIRARVDIGGEIERLASVVNDTKTRELGIDKWAQYQLAEDFMPVTRKLDPRDNITSELLDSIPGDRVVIKKSGGGEGRWIAIADKTLPAAENAVAEMRRRIAEKLVENPDFYQDLIIQEFVAGEFINGLRPISDEMNATESNVYNTLGKHGHEIRFYGFLRGENGIGHDYFANLRAFDTDSEGQWIFIHESSLPEGAVLLAQQISDRFIRHTGSRGALVAIDVFRGQRASDDEPRWLVREINAKDPIMAKSTRSFKAAYAQRAKLAQLLVDVAGSRREQGI